MFAARFRSFTAISHEDEGGKKQAGYRKPARSLNLCNMTSKNKQDTCQGQNELFREVIPKYYFQLAGSTLKRST